MASGDRVRAQVEANEQRPFSNRGHDRVLQDFGVHFEGGDFRITAQCAQNRVGDIADAGLQGQELRRNAFGFHLGDQEIGDIFADLIG